MKLKNQILSLEQIKKLRELGFDVNKHASVEINTNINKKQYVVSSSFVKLYPKFGDDDVIERYSTMTIGDIIEVLPKKIKTYSANADKEIYFYLNMDHVGIMYIPTMIDDCMFCSIEDKLINNLFNTLIWCIKEKHI